MTPSKSTQEEVERKAREIFDKILEVGCCDNEEDEACDNRQPLIIAEALLQTRKEAILECAELANNLTNVCGECKTAENLENLIRGLINEPKESNAK